MSAYWFEKAAEQGNAEAEWRLSGTYGAGEGVPRDDKSALNWLKKAAEDGQVQRAMWGRDFAVRPTDARPRFDNGKVPL